MDKLKDLQKKKDTLFRNMVKLQKESGKTQEEFAASLGMSRQNFDRMKRTSDIMMSYVIKASLLYGVDIASLFTPEIKPADVERRIDEAVLKERISHLNDKVVMTNAVLDVKNWAINRLEIENQELKNRIEELKQSIEELKEQSN